MATTPEASDTIKPFKSDLYAKVGANPIVDDLGGYRCTCASDEPMKQVFTSLVDGARVLYYICVFSHRWAYDVSHNNWLFEVEPLDGS